MKKLAKDLKSYDFFMYGSDVCLVLDVKIDHELDESVLSVSFLRSEKFYVDFKIGANTKLMIP